MTLKIRPDSDKTEICSAKFQFGPSRHKLRQNLFNRYSYWKFNTVITIGAGEHELSHFITASQLTGPGQVAIWPWP